MTYDAAHRQAVLFGGDLPERRDTWTWDGNDWTHHAPPKGMLPTRFAAMAYDSATEQVVQFGGLHPHGSNSNTWLWDGADWTKRPSGWIALSQRSGPPDTRVQVKGWGFTPDQLVQLTFLDSVEGQTILKTTRLNDLGRFRVTITIPSTATEGRQLIMATVEARGGSRGRARRSFTVTGS
jgi:hypothetical protein